MKILRSISGISHIIRILSSTRRIQYERESFFPNLREKVSMFGAESDPYISAIRHFYEKPDDLYRALNVSLDDVKVVWGDGFFYYNIKDVFEFDWKEHECFDRKQNAGTKKSSANDRTDGTSHFKQTNSEKQERKYSRPYWHSWFSPEAHKLYSTREKRNIFNQRLNDKLTFLDYTLIIMTDVWSPEAKNGIHRQNNIFVGRQLLCVENIMAFNGQS